MTEHYDIERLPQISKNKIIVLLNQKSVRNIDYISSFSKPRDIYLISILLHYQIYKGISNREIIISISELQELYKVFRGEAKYDLMGYINELDSKLFTTHILNKESEIFCYKLNKEYFNITDSTFYFNIATLKKLKINSQKIALYLASLGPHAKYLHLSFISSLLGIEHKDHKLKQKSAKVVFDTLLKHSFIKSYNYERTEKKFYFKIEKPGRKELIQSLNFDNDLDFN